MVVPTARQLSLAPIVRALRKTIIADQNKSKQAMADAAQLLFNGQLMG